MSKFNPNARRKARYYAVQALYQWQLSHNDPSEIVAQFMIDYDFKKVDRDYFKLLLDAIPEELPDLDALLESASKRKLGEIDPVELAILRLSCYELKALLEVPYRVVINEALELAKTFGSVDGYKFINGILDKLAQQLRALEFNNPHKTG